MLTAKSLFERGICFDWYFTSLCQWRPRIRKHTALGNVTKGWTNSNSKIGYDWLINVYNHIFKARCPGESHLLILDGHVLHINDQYKFLGYCRQNEIIVFCLPPYSTHLLWPLDVGLFSQLQTHRKAVEDYFLSSTGRCCKCGSKAGARGGQEDLAIKESLSAIGKGEFGWGDD